MKLSLITLFTVLLINIKSVHAEFNPVGSGDEIQDTKTGLIWKRCPEGKLWSNNTCSGISSKYSHEQALIRASNQSGWRLPNVKELASILDFSKNFPKIDENIFPAISNRYFWTSTPYLRDPSSAYSIDFVDGTIDYWDARSTTYAIRLVR